MWVPVPRFWFFHHPPQHSTNHLQKHPIKVKSQIPIITYEDSQSPISMASLGGVTMIGLNFTSYQSRAKSKNHDSHSDVPMCTSKLCPVTDPHPAIPFRSTYKGLPKMVFEMECQVDGKTKDQITWLDTFYTIHWDHVKWPMPKIRECVDKKCPIWEWSNHTVGSHHGKRPTSKARQCVNVACPILAVARHEAKQYSQSPKKQHALPVRIQELQNHPDLARKYEAELELFWKMHGAQDPLEKSDEIRKFEAGLMGCWKLHSTCQ